MYNLNFLQEFGLSGIQIRIYEFLIRNKFGTIDTIKNELNYSYAQVRENLIILEQKHLVSSSDGKPKLHFRVNPKLALTELLKSKNEKILEKINTLEDDIKANESEKGYCTRQISLYHHSDVNTGLEELYALLDGVENEILLSSLPPSLIRKLEPSLYQAFLRGVRIKVYFSKLDFEKIDNYFGIISDILKNIKLHIIEVEERVCRFVRYNDMIVNEGNILIDHHLNSVLFTEDNYFHFSGFSAPNIVKNVKGIYERVKTPIKSVEINPDPLQKVIEQIKAHPDIKTRDLSIKSQLSGEKLREILDYLIEQGFVKEEKIQGEVGRPKIVYSLPE
ncbi:MAG: hypothetical protein GF317_22040 [Candidatus Lokiarchaeota archaeon]|nr:hypothetical protein [Candidatus Lokiarchaeota archaeon]MBD3202141.1 hypothetical protein [Candidatus Lokiarchaeota archaeon]